MLYTSINFRWVAMKPEITDDGSSASIELSGPQTEFLMKLEQLLACLASSDATINMQAQPEVCRRPFIIVKV